MFLSSFLYLIKGLAWLGVSTFKNNFYYNSNLLKLYISKIIVWFQKIYFWNPKINFWTQV